MANFESFNPAIILRQATPETVARGRSYFFAGRASVIACSRYRSVVTVRGSATEPYNVVLRWGENGAESECDCPYAEDEPRLICKHKVAAALATEHYLRLHPRVSWQSVLDEALATTVKPAAKATKLALIFSLQQRYGAWGVFVYTLAATHFDPAFAADASHIVETVVAEHLSSKAKLARQSLDTQRVVNATGPVLIAADLCWAYVQASTYSWNMPHSVHRLIPFLKDCPLFFGSEEVPLKEPLAIDHAPALLQVELTRHDNSGLRVRPVVVLPSGGKIDLQEGSAKFISATPGWLMHGHRLTQVDGPLATIEPLTRHAELVVPDSEMADFTNRYLAPLAARLPITGDGFEWTDLEAKARPRLYLKQSDLGDPVAELRFAYGDGDNPLVLGLNTTKQETEVVHVAKDQVFVRVRRDVDAEDAAEAVVTQNGLRRDHKTGQFALRASTNVLSFLMHQVPRMVEAGFEIYGEENLSGAKINRAMPNLTMHVSSGIDWFDVKMGVTFGDATAPLKAIRQAIKKRERYIKLSDGSIGALPDDWVKKYSYLFSLGTDLHDDDRGEGGLRLQKHHALLLGDFLDGAESAVEADEAFRETLQRLRDFSRIEDHPLPAGLRATLRPYQEHGFDWLHFLREYGAGGCIADDMGLGKTVQVLALLQSLSERTTTPRRASLIVVPRSLIFNWQREAATFTPQLEILLHADQQRERTARNFDRHDIVLTTYGILVRDIELLKGHMFRVAVLDESQAIKNPAALSAKASRMLKAEQRVTLTGTPVENSTQDLWSQFAFLNPGLLGTLEQFRGQFGTAIDRTQDEEKAHQLRRLVHPFVLRRTKEQVAPELPPRTERILYTEMEPEQRKVYDETKEFYQKQLLGLIDSEGMGKARMKVLEGLLRLRQISNHPKLVDPSYDGPSAKFEGLLQTLLTLKSEGHKALVFSQFVQMLTLLRGEMERLDMPFELLTGQTRDRQSRVDSFQNNPEIPFFLISLRAGGVGLNLTAADYVIHIDPWWNPAVEMQATDRTHRIGQDKPVFIYKLIARDTVEDKILQLQDRKREVVKQVVSTEGGFFKDLTRDDIAGLFGA